MSAETTEKKTRKPRSSTPLAEAARNVDKATRKVAAAQAAVVTAQNEQKAATDELVRLSQGAGRSDGYQDNRGGGIQAP